MACPDPNALMDLTCSNESGAARSRYAVRGFSGATRRGQGGRPRQVIFHAS